MSRYSGKTTCPNCGKDADLYSDWKPFNYSMIKCPHCGLRIFPILKYMTLKDLNKYRRDNGMTLLRKKPEQNKSIW